MALYQLQSVEIRIMYNYKSWYRNVDLVCRTAKWLQNVGKSGCGNCCKVTSQCHTHTHTLSLSPAHSTSMQRTRPRQVLHVTGQDFYSNSVFTSSWPHQQCDLCGRWSWCVDRAHAGCKTNQPSISTVISTHWSISELYTPCKIFRI